MAISDSILRFSSMPAFFRPATTKLTRGYRQPSYVDKTNAATIKSMLPYA